MKEGMIWQKLEREKRTYKQKDKNQKTEKELLSYLHNSESAICFNILWKLRFKFLSFLTVLFLKPMES